MNNEIIKKVLEKRYGHLNPMQRQAVFQIQGPLLILAGAGSGKTTVLINRIQYMVEFGDCYHAGGDVALSENLKGELEKYISAGEKPSGDWVSKLAYQPVRPWNVLAITFTNKAAGELRERLKKVLGEDVAGDIQASTFHSLCVRILRREISVLGYDRSFTIYDTDDSLRVIKAGVKFNNLDEKTLTPRAILSAIGRAKDEMLSPDELLKESAHDYRAQCIAKVYDYYESTLRSANALDFDDIILKTVMIFQQYPQVLEHYQNRYRYIMVDEYQDTNKTQYLLVSMLARKHKNLCVVGDDDQSIYKFRGATIENILSFEHQFEGSKVIRLEQNYRSSQNILTAANQLISNNTARKGKNLWTDAGEGQKIALVQLSDETQEARYIADTMMEHAEKGGKWSDNAVLYRMNAQSGAIERALAQRAIPYKIVGGLRFYERKEIKDVIAYLSVINNPTDDLRLNRIINEPKRGIGATTMTYAAEIAEMMNEPLFTVVTKADQYAPLSRASNNLLAFAAIIQELIDQVDSVSLGELLDNLLEKTGYIKYLEAEGFEGVTRIENVMELKTNILQYAENAEEPSLAEFLEEIALYTDLDNYDTETDAVTLMTIHSAKGLEFPNIFIAGMEEGVFPGRNAQNFPDEIEEERRLAYVAITRAKENLYITSTQRRMLFGQTTWGRPSRFISEIPKEVAETEKAGFDAKETSTQRPKTDYKKRAMGIPTAAKKSEEIYIVGDKVSHSVFGEGEVIDSRPMGGDTLLEVAFGDKGSKKIMANFAKMKNCKKETVMSGKLIVIEGLDGSGKATQSALLSEFYTLNGTPNKHVTFPDYDSPSSNLIKMYLKGEIGDVDQVGAYAATSFYAADRYISYETKWKINYTAGELIIADRYSTSNFIYQMAKLPEEEWQEYLEWAGDYEYNRLGLPKPDRVIYLDVLPEISQKLLSERYNGDDSKKDIHEKNIRYLLRCRQSAFYAAERLGWTVISCSENGGILPIETVFAKIIVELNRK